MERMMKKLAGASLLLLGSVMQAAAHPHVFAEARLEVAAAPDGTIAELRHVWRFDELFSSTVLLEFDADADGSLSVEELEQVADVVTRSIADYGYFQSVTVEDKDIALAPVEGLTANMVDGQLLILFAAKTQTPVKLADGPKIGVFDPTFYTAIEFYSEDEMVLLDAPAGCGHKMVVPDPDEAIAQNQQSLTEAFFDDPGGNDMSRILATRMEISCS